MNASEVEYNADRDTYSLGGGELTIWLDQAAGIICLKVTTPYNDPVELNEDGTEELANLLLKLVKEIK